MQFTKEITLHTGESCLLKSLSYEDAYETHKVFLRTHEETDNLLTYPEENTFTAEQEGDFLQEQYDSDNAIEIGAYINGVLVGTAGIEPVSNRYKQRHRAEFGISILQAYWGRGVGRALTQACMDCAIAAGYQQIELDVVSTNVSAIRLYESLGFVEYGRNPLGFRSKLCGWQELILMRLVL